MARCRGSPPGVNFVALKVLDAEGRGRTSDVIRAIEFAIANRRRFGIDIINLSLGHPIFEPAATDPLVQAVEKAVQAGIIVVASAGNFGSDSRTGNVGYAGITSPGQRTLRHHRRRLQPPGHGRARRRSAGADYSSRGPTWYDGLAKPDVVAPGHQLLAELAPGSALANTYPQFVRDRSVGPLLPAAVGHQHGGGRDDRRRRA